MEIQEPNREVPAHCQRGQKNPRPDALKTVRGTVLCYLHNPFHKVAHFSPREIYWPAIISTGENESVRMNTQVPQLCSMLPRKPISLSSYSEHGVMKRSTEGWSVARNRAGFGTECIKGMQILPGSPSMNCGGTSPADPPTWPTGTPNAPRIYHTHTYIAVVSSLCAPPQW